MALGPTLRHLRKNLQLTLVQVGERTDLSVSFLSDIERGKANPSMESLEKLAAVYGVDVDTLARELEPDYDPVDKTYPPGFGDFLDEFKTVDAEIQQILLRIENRSARRPQTKQDWIQLYYSVKTILGQ